MTRWARLRRWVRHNVLGQHVWRPTHHLKHLGLYERKCSYPGCYAHQCWDDGTNWHVRVRIPQPMSIRPPRQ